MFMEKCDKCGKLLNESVNIILGDTEDEDLQLCDSCAMIREAVEKA